MAHRVDLSDLDLAKIGLTTVLEARAKSLAATALRVVEERSFADWVKFERWQFKQILERLIPAVAGGDKALRDLVDQLELCRASSHELRHIVVHAMWNGTGEGNPPSAYDYSRTRLLSADDIEAAVNGCNDLYQRANAVTYRCAQLVHAGVYPEREAGPGPHVCVNDRWVRL